MGLGIIGALIGAALEELGDVTRAAISASLRDVADKVERGEIVSDQDIDSLRSTTERIRAMLERAGSSG